MRRSNRSKQAPRNKNLGFSLIALLAMGWLATGCAKRQSHRYVRQQHRTHTTQITRSSAKRTTDSLGARQPQPSGRAPTQAALHPSNQPIPSKAGKSQGRGPRGPIKGEPVKALVAKATIEEADLYRVQGSTLYYLHSHRGLTVFELSTPEKPKRVATLPVYGTPVEMYVEGDKAYILVNNVMRLRKQNDSLFFEAQNKSQLISVDISTPSSPEILQELDIPGEIREGMTRKRGSLLYVVSSEHETYQYKWKMRSNGQRHRVRVFRPETLLIQSFRAQDGKLRTLDKMTCMQARLNIHKHQPNVKHPRHSYYGRYVVTATDSTFLVSENWRVMQTRRYRGGFQFRRYYSRSYRYGRRYYRRGGYYRRCYEQKTQYYTRVHVIDISKNSGKLHQHNILKLEGTMSDQFKQTSIEDPNTGKKTYLGVTMNQMYQYNNCNYRRRRNDVRNTLQTFDVTRPGEAKKLAELAFGKPRETVRGSLFDPERRVLYAITAVRRDPMYAISFSDPARPKILSAIDGLSGDIQMFRLLNNGNFLLAVGRDTSTGCKGFGRGFWRSNVAVSLFDIRDLHRTRLIERRCVNVKGMNRTYSNVNRNRNQAHKMVGMYQKGNLNLLTVPFYFYSRYNYRQYGYHRNAVSLMSWDLRDYDPRKGHRNQHVLHNLGTFLHPFERVKRTIITDIPQKNKDRRIAINLSNNYISVVDLDDLNKPKYLTSRSIASTTKGAYKMGDYLVEHVHIRHLRRVEARLDVRKIIGKRTGPIVNSIPLKRVVKIHAWKRKLVVVRYPMDERGSGKHVRLVRNTAIHELAIYDFKRPESPRYLGSTRLQSRLISGATSSCSGNCSTQPGSLAHFQYNSPVSKPMLKTRRGFVFLNQRAYRIFGIHQYRQEIVTVDLTSRRPRIQHHALPFGHHKGLVPFVSGFFVVQMAGFHSYTGHIQRWTRTRSGWNRDPWTITPGHLLHAYRGKKGKIYLVTYTNRAKQIALSEYLPGQSKVKRIKVFHAHARSLLFYKTRMYMTLAASGGTSLGIYNMSTEGFVKLYQHPLCIGVAALRYRRGHRLLLQLPRTLLWLDVKEYENPTMLGFHSLPVTAGLSIHGPLQIAASSASYFLPGQMVGTLSVTWKRPPLLAEKTTSMKQPLLQR